jgi:hypothetical protein
VSADTVKIKAGLHGCDQVGLIACAKSHIGIRQRHARAAVWIAVGNRDVEKSAVESLAIIEAAITPHKSYRPCPRGFERIRLFPSSRQVIAHRRLVRLDHTHVDLLLSSLCPRSLFHHPHGPEQRSEKRLCDGKLSDVDYKITMTNNGLVLACVINAVVDTI